MTLGPRLSIAFAATVALAACGGSSSDEAGSPPSPQQQSGQRPPQRGDEWTEAFLLEFTRVPDAAPAPWKRLIGEYGTDTTNRWFVIERDKRIWVMDQYKYYVPLTEKSDSVFEAPFAPVPVQGAVKFSIVNNAAESITTNGITMQRRHVEPPEGAAQLKITPVRPVDELRKEALAATPPAEKGPFVKTDLVELVKLDSTIKLDIRYAGENNFLGTKMYDDARAFMQRDAAKALVRAAKNAKRVGYGLLVHDAYRPWYVTKIFWEATPVDKRWMVANPADGSKHNRGIAVDITLYDLATKQVADMPSTYDESTERAFSAYPGGTSQQRYHRLLLRKLLEHEGFVVNPKEWWHFDYFDRKKYEIGNIPFDKIPETPVEAPKTKAKK